MLIRPALDLRIVSGDELPDAFREALRPGELVMDSDGKEHRLPTYFYEIPSWEIALETQLTPHFGLWELIDVDVREAEPMRSFPRYVPCAITLLAAALQLVRSEVGRVVRIAANGGYRSPSHHLDRAASPHQWGSAANVYRIGDDWLDNRNNIEKYVDVVRHAIPGAWVRSYGDTPGHVFDQLHLDLGFVTLEPHRKDEAAESEGDDGDED